MWASPVGADVQHFLCPLERAASMEVLRGKGALGTWLGTGDSRVCVPGTVTVPGTTIMRGYSLNVRGRGWCSRVKDDESERQLLSRSS